MGAADTLTRAASEQDIPKLKALWKEVFDDTDADINHFFSTWFDPELTVVIDDAGEPVCAAYVLPVGSLVLPDFSRRPCAMIYAVATHADFRRRSYGEAVTRAAAVCAAGSGYPAVVLKPASGSLFDFYEKRSDFRDFFDAYSSDFSSSELTAKDSGFTLSAVTPGEYRLHRNRCLMGHAYIDMDERAIAYQQYLSGSGGGIFVLKDPSGAVIGCTAAETDGSAGILKELLLSAQSDIFSAVSAAAAALGISTVSVRCFTDYGHPEKFIRSRFGMLIPLPSMPALPKHTGNWYGFAFD